MDDYVFHGTATFEIDDPLDHPFYEWPRSLVGFPVTFESPVAADDLGLFRGGEPVPFQLAEAEHGEDGLESATVTVATDLPRGASRRFELREVESPPDPEPAAGAVTVDRDGSVVLDAGALRVRLPGSASAPDDPSGPIAALDRGEGWVGESSFDGAEVTEVDTAVVAAGPLFATARVRYAFAGGGGYEATVRAVAGREFVGFRESMDDPPEGAAVEMRWTGFDPTHRHATNHPPTGMYGDEPGWDRYDWEEIDQRYNSTPNGLKEGRDPETGEIDYQLGRYEPWGADNTLTVGTFWDEESDDALGVFVDDTGGWDDGDYSIWRSSETLQVRYLYDGTLRWRWPLAGESRSTGIACYDHARDRESMDELETLRGRAEAGEFDLDYDVELSPRTHTTWLRVKYGALTLDDVAGWDLRYDGEVLDAFDRGRFDDAEELYEDVMTGGHGQSFGLHSPQQNAGYGPVDARDWYEKWTDGYARLADDLDPERREQLTAVYLLLANVSAGEEFMPVRSLLSGHPNFHADSRATLGFVASLFPDHPAAATWADAFAAFMRVNGRFHTRPDVPAWRTRGGRWTENVSCYLWSAMRALVRAGHLLRDGGGPNVFATDEYARLAEWVVGSLSAPFEGEAPAGEAAYDPVETLEKHRYGRVYRGEGPRRVIPAQGSHAARGTPPREAWLIGQFLRQYRPLTAEHLLWATDPTDSHAEDPETDLTAWNLAFDAYEDGGTNPRLESASYTGYGHVLRTGVDTPAEVSVHLWQIDHGPNYRWGIAGNGGCGVLHYAAAGEMYTHRGKEDVGDRPAHDTDFCTNTGVWSEDGFYSIGRNVLDGPLYDLDGTVFAEITPREADEESAWPAYQSRSTLLVGTDYLVTYDAVYDEGVPHRFAWFADRDDPFPSIDIVRGGGQRTSVETEETRGVWHDGQGDCLAVVSHRDVSVEPVADGAGARVETPDGTDHVFRSQNGVTYDDGDRAFAGEAGVVREGDQTELALVRGDRVAGGGVGLEARGVAAAARFETPDDVTVTTDSRDGGTVRLDGVSGVVYVDGEPQGSADGDVEVDVGAGSHRVELRDGEPTPPAPAVVRTEDRADGTTLVWTPVAGAQRYRVEVSDDGGETWTAATTVAATEADVDLPRGKHHLRVVATNDEREGPPADDYPVYIEDETPAHPEGLSLSLGEASVQASWGEVLGVSAYVLYRRRGDGDWTEQYRGLDTRYEDTVDPGADVEYAVAAENAVGEGGRSLAVDADPDAWHNWDPAPGERFRRNHPYTLNFERPAEGELPEYPSTGAGRKG
jgi:hypothetical protein